MKSEGEAFAVVCGARVFAMIYPCMLTRDYATKKTRGYAEEGCISMSLVSTSRL